jgi:hypothetical protein
MAVSMRDALLRSLKLTHLTLVQAAVLVDVEQAVALVALGVEQAAAVVVAWVVLVAVTAVVIIVAVNSVKSSIKRFEASDT